MNLPNLNVFYVEDIPRSTTLYRSILDMEPVEASPGFVLFILPSGLKIGLWHRPAASPAGQGSGGSELGFTVEDRAAVLKVHQQWQALGLRIVQPPSEVDFGYTVCAFDPDGHCLRAYCVEDDA
ncbi:MULTISPECIES: VOC family protein [unclassified Pseudomonas]|uniref:VOC family protein n=1 Tax=unclassified Pseudomonas TaxID=196821 RepID=UPI000BD72129|nr:MULTISPECIES: VOC family protein [unclassified Pseudomonas]PVZ16497.1 catechol 2,3-dioxygenase-like lactoylglutathione lyase family enzyme [Pseudomonas sp. URIL14HWK12:I12]PVZ25647.1 catechol 2,3-dioxygenase-like lactoylglutathione lyase family enzyme [Pseudomonas sp. URIL14HWK12:I10]PVZ36829.1 catechol 2,3-dioxygenase-like lactoylglutathione lyase family enzyme [Pseudomonas sp. URIL14HWK12:I11]SNZ12530.1 Catechol 2,3-dioxygenase [Pseudomonas sp. URIL14HWK12:I9]